MFSLFFVFIFYPTEASNYSLSSASLAVLQDIPFSKPHLTLADLHGNHNKKPWSASPLQSVVGFLLFFFSFWVVFCPFSLTNRKKSSTINPNEVVICDYTKHAANKCQQ